MVADMTNDYLVALFVDNTVEIYESATGRSMKTIKHVSL